MKQLRIIKTFVGDIVHSRYLIWQLTKKDLQTRYLGSYLGMLWAFVQPIVTILIFWFVFEVGFKSMPIDNYPFILWLIVGIVPWFFVAEGVQSASHSVLESSFLVKKIVFRVSILPVIKILSATLIHLVFVIFLISLLWIYGYPPVFLYFQVLYYLFAALVLLIGFSWITSSLIIFLKDVGQILAMMLQFGFWITPIFWSLKLIPEKYHIFIALNPAYYIIEGYRNTFIFHRLFWSDSWMTVYFWGVALVFFCGGALLFHRLRPHFADVL